MAPKNMQFIFLKKYYNCIFLVFFLNCIISCKKFVEIPPPNSQLVRATVFTSNATANAAQLAIYSQMAMVAENDITVNGGISSDEFVDYTMVDTRDEIYKNSILPTNGTINNSWGVYYNLIYQANAVLEGAQNSSQLTKEVQQQLIGESKFVRAFFYFYLVNLFGDVPLVLNTNYENNKVVARSPKSDVYQQIINDLTDAQTLLSDKFVGSDGVSSTMERLRPTKWAASALLARVYLYTGDWAKAEMQATSVINNSTLFSLVSDLNNVFLKNSNEAIWQLTIGTDQGFNTIDGLQFILFSIPSNVALNTTLLNSFEANDNRKISWINSYTEGAQTYYYPFKYKVWIDNNITEYTMALRLAELYLIRAEARAQQNNLSDAVSDINVIRTRAGLPNTTSVTQSEVLSAILHERQVELFTEWAHRWLDLKRTNNIDVVMVKVTPLKGAPWNTNQKLYPIPQAERNLNPSLTQNPGY